MGMSEYYDVFIVLIFINCILVGNIYNCCVNFLILLFVSSSFWIMILKEFVKYYDFLNRRGKIGIWIIRFFIFEELEN